MSKEVKIVSDIDKVEEVLEWTKFHSKNGLLSNKFREHFSDASYHLEKVIISINELNETLDN